MTAQNPQDNRDAAIVLSLLGLLVTCLFSPFAIWQAKKAQAGGVDAKVWEILGWVGLILGTFATVIWFGLIAVSM